MVSGVYGYSGQDIYRQQAQKRAAEWAQRSAAQLQAAQGQQAGQVQYAQQPQQGYVQYTQQSQPTQQVQQPKGCTDGKDDGKIGFWEGLKSFGKGALKFVGGLVGFDQNGNWSLGRALKNVAIGAGIIAIGALTGGTAFIIGAGVATAGAGLVKSQYQFWTAKTDADAKAAMEGTGSNALALGLALTGAKGVMSKVNPTKNYNGFTGTLKAGWDSVNLLPTKVFNGIKSGYQVYKNGGGWSGVKNLVTESGKNYWNDTIKTNWANATKTPTVAETQEARVAKIDKQIETLKAKATKAEELAKAKKSAHPEKAPQKLKFERQIKRLEAQKAQVQQAYNDINSVKSFKAAQTKINKVESNIAKLERNLENATTRAQKYEYTKALNEAKQQLNIYKNVVDAKTSQARNLQAQIERCDKEAFKDGTSSKRVNELVAKQKELVDQQKALDFDLPKGQHKTYSEKAAKSSTEFLKKQEAYDKAKAELNAARKANSKFKKGDPSDEARLAQRKVCDAQTKLNNATEKLDKARITNNSNIAYSNATSGYDVSGTVSGKAGAFVKSFNNMYGELHTPFMGKTVPFTNWSVPGRNLGIGKAWTIPATGEIGVPVVDGWSLKVDNPSVGGPSLNDIALKELQYEQVAQAKSQLMQQGYTEAQATALINEAMNGGGAAQTATAQAQYTTPQFGQYTTGQAPFGMNLQNLDYQMKSLNLI